MGAEGSFHSCSGHLFKPCTKDVDEKDGMVFLPLYTAPLLRGFDGPAEARRAEACQRYPMDENISIA